MEAKEVDTIIKDVGQARLNYEMRWYIIDRFFDGVHFDRVLKVNSDGSFQLEKPTFQKGIRPIPIPRVDKQIESILNILFFNKPVWKLYPLEADSILIDFTDKMGDAMDVLYDVLEIQNKLKLATADALKYYTSYLEVGIDYKDNLFVEKWSPWSIYHDIGIENLEQTRFLIKVIKKTLQDIKLNSSYNQEVVEQIKTEGKESFSMFYEQRFKEKFAHQIKLSDESKNFVLIKEVWFREGETWKMGVECQGKWLREPQEVPYFPFIALTFGNSNDIYGTSLAEKLIPLNRELDMLVAYIKHFIYTTSQGKLLEPKGSKIERILDQHGERIRYEGGREPRWLDIPQLSPATTAFLQLLQTYMDERGIAVLSFGKLPSAKLGWKALESLKQIELGNMQGFVEKITETIRKIGYKILEIGENAWVGDDFNGYRITNGDKTFNLVSEAAYRTMAKFQTDEKTIPISTKWGIKVEIESGLAYTEEGKMEKLLELLKAGVVSPEEVREKLKLGPSPVKEAEKALLEKVRTEAIAQEPLEQNLTEVGNLL
jgi:hypothetical protein